MDGEYSPLWMKVNSGTKIKNVLEYALKHFPQRHNIIIWTGAGQAVGKVISCVELFKKQNPGLHQVTKLRYINSKNEARNVEKTQQVPEINIFLAQETMHVSKFEHQWACDMGICSPTSSETSQTLKLRQDIRNMCTMSNMVGAEFPESGHKKRKKRSRIHQTDLSNIKKRKRVEEKSTLLS